MLFIELFKLVCHIAQRFAGTQNQKSIGFKGVLKQREESLLDFGVEVNEKIATTEQIDFAEWRILYEVVCRENDHFTDFLGNPKPFILRYEVAAQEMSRHFVCDTR